MRMRTGLVAALLAVAAGVTAQTKAPELSVEQQRLVAAKRDAAIATARAARLAAAATQERNAADKARREEQALAARVTAAEANLATASARVTLVERLLTDQRVRLARAQAPVSQLIAALESLARRPTIVAVAQPGSIDDLVHVRAVLGSVLPVVRQRTEAVRIEIAETRRLRASATLAAKALSDGRARLENDRIALAELEARHRQRSQALGRGALSESDRALALGERARDLVDGMAATTDAKATAASLIALAGPIPRPIAPGVTPPAPPRGVYRMPVAGRLVTGFDELSDSGVRSRGLTFATAPRARVVAPAAGTIRYARRFRDYGVIVIIDHANGWTSLVTGLAATSAKTGDRIAMGTPIGTAPGEEPRITVELRRRGRPVDAASLIGPR
ncbi:murein hydrolase activator EnvC family protein [Sphingomonas faeni]|uniref:murein hydrolase activator EnvC family protein n=1 Tax=Sphingomonas faeni TaxID=185950 RepID=UPI00277FF3DF|nr:peptidoglycan DD-metalloendopeptidase family protein [Sphingomonas faeni]MDQ0838476.1 murein DD-endopeptidase MepM/ murein hydrolase activator NlpD [Sphingomonas faeni]